MTSPSMVPSLMPQHRRTRSPYRKRLTDAPRKEVARLSFPQESVSSQEPSNSRVVSTWSLRKVLSWSLSLTRHSILLWKPHGRDWNASISHRVSMLSRRRTLPSLAREPLTEAVPMTPGGHGVATGALVPRKEEYHRRKAVVPVC